MNDLERLWRVFLEKIPQNLFGLCFGIDLLLFENREIQGRAEVSGHRPGIAAPDGIGDFLVKVECTGGRRSEQYEEQEQKLDFHGCWVNGKYHAMQDVDQSAKDTAKTGSYAAIPVGFPTRPVDRKRIFEA